jgi:membrane associated rhomboid family serine protease
MTDFRPSRFQILPVVVKNIIIINALMVFAQFVLGRFGIDLADYLGLHYWRSHYFKPWQFITHMFMHGSYNDVQATILHLFSNMFALWMFGSILENVWGPKRFLTFYIICGLGAAVLHLGVVAYEFHVIEQAFIQYQNNPTLDSFNRFIQQHYHGGASAPVINNIQQVYEHWNSNASDSSMVSTSVKVLNQYLSGTTYQGTFYPGIYDEATVGASGAVFGILFAFGYLFPNTLLYIYFLVPLKAKYFVAMYALFELYAGIRNSAGDNVAHFAHLGGMLVAFILLKIWNKRNRKHFY